MADSAAPCVIVSRPSYRPPSIPGADSQRTRDPLEFPRLLRSAPAGGRVRVRGVTIIDTLADPYATAPRCVTIRARTVIARPAELLTAYTFSPRAAMLSSGMVLRAGSSPGVFVL